MNLTLSSSTFRNLVFLKPTLRSLCFPCSPRFLACIHSGRSSTRQQILRLQLKAITDRPSRKTRSSLIAPNKAPPSRQDEPSSSRPADPHSVVGVRQCAVVLLATAKLGTHTNVYVGKERKETGSSQRLAPAIRVSDEVIKPCAHIISDGLFCTHVHGKALQFQR